MTTTPTPTGVTTHLHLMLSDSAPPQVDFRYDPNTAIGYLTLVAEVPFHRHRVCVSGTPAELETVLLTALAHLRQPPEADQCTFAAEVAHLELGPRAATGSPLPERAPVGVGA